jgi:hypothetical protein
MHRYHPCLFRRLLATDTRRRERRNVGILRRQLDGSAKFGRLRKSQHGPLRRKAERTSCTRNALLPPEVPRRPVHNLPLLDLAHKLQHERVPLLLVAARQVVDKQAHLAFEPARLERKQFREPRRRIGREARGRQVLDGRDRRRAEQVQALRVVCIKGTSIPSERRTNLAKTKCVKQLTTRRLSSHTGANPPASDFHLSRNGPAGCWPNWVVGQKV